MSLHYLSELCVQSPALIGSHLLNELLVKEVIEVDFFLTELSHLSLIHISEPTRPKR